MASQDGSAYRMDPVEMLWDCSIRVVCAGEDVVVELARNAGVAQVTRLAADRAVQYTPDVHAAHQPAA